MKKIASTGLLVIVGLTLCLAKKNEVSLKLNYATKAVWTYGLSYRSECLFTDTDSTSKKTTSVSATLVGAVSEEKNRIDISANNLKLESQIYSTDVKKKILETTDSPFPLALRDGIPVVDTQTARHDIGLPEWDLYLHLARILPDMPGQAVSEGFSYERHAMLPIKSDRGRVPCDMYRQYLVEKISPEGDTAVIRWQFNYASMRPATDSVSILSIIPVEGKGKGSATIDVRKGFLIDAEIEFETPVISLGTSKVNWKESAKLTFQKAQ